MPDLSGLTVSVPLLLDSDYSIDYPAMENYLDKICQSEHVYAVYSMAYNTRYRMLDHSEITALNKFICSRVKAYGQRVFVGHPYVFTRKELESYMENIADDEPDGISMLYPERYFGQIDPVMEFLRLPESFGMRTVLHEMPLVSGLTGNLVHWPDELSSAVFNEVDLIAVKEDSKDDRETLKLLALAREAGCQFILAGGGKLRAQKFLSHGIDTWLNGSTMMFPSLIDKVYVAYATGDDEFTNFFNEHIEIPFFEQCVAKYGWHLAHKAALHYFGFGQPTERFPHAKVTSDIYSHMSLILSDIKKKSDQL